jgi:hypothetical protein
VMFKVPKSANAPTPAATVLEDQFPTVGHEPPARLDHVPFVCACTCWCGHAAISGASKRNSRDGRKRKSGRRFIWRFGGLCWMLGGGGRPGFHLVSCNKTRDTFMRAQSWQAHQHQFS